MVSACICLQTTDAERIAHCTTKPCTVSLLPNVEEACGNAARLVHFAANRLGTPSASFPRRRQHKESRRSCQQPRGRFEASFGHRRNRWKRCTVCRRTRRPRRLVLIGACSAFRQSTENWSHDHGSRYFILLAVSHRFAFFGTQKAHSFFPGISAFLNS